MRQLTKQEKEMTEKGIKNCDKQLKEFFKRLELVKLQQNFIMQKREYEDKVRPFNREIEDKEWNNALSEVESQIKLTTEKIEVMNNQLKNGVEIKKEFKEPTPNYIN